MFLNDFLAGFDAACRSMRSAGAASQQFSKGVEMAGRLCQRRSIHALTSNALRASLRPGRAAANKKHRP